MTTKPDRKSRHKALLRDVGKLINQPADSIAVRLVALARLKMDAVEAQLLSGDPGVTIGDIQALEGVFSKYAPPQKIEVRVKFADAADVAAPDSAAVDGLIACRRCRWAPFDKDRVTRCYRCGWVHGADVHAAWSPVIEPATSHATINDRGHMTPAPSPAGSPAPANVVSIDEQRSEQAAEKRRLARISNNIDPGPARPAIVGPSIGASYESPAALSRRISEAYR